MLLAGVRVVQRQSLQFILSAVFATGIAAFFALRSGRAEDAFLPGILGSAAGGWATLISVLVRWPLVGFMVGAGDPRLAEDPFAWRRDPGLVRVSQRQPGVLVALYAVRVAIMLPLYFAGEVAWLGILQVALGWPAWLVAVAVMGAMLLRGETAQVVPAPDSETTWQDAHHEHDGHAPGGHTSVDDDAHPRGPEGRLLHPARNPARRTEHRLEVVLELGCGDEQQLVVWLEAVVTRGRDRVVLADEPTRTVSPGKDTSPTRLPA